MMSSRMASPCKGHLEQVIHFFSYLEKHQNSEIIFYPSDAVLDEATCEFKDWASSDFGHVQGHEELLPNMSEPRGLRFLMRAKVDADNASVTVAEI